MPATILPRGVVPLGYVAALTSTVEVVTGALILPQRQTVLGAKQAAEVDLLSRGRPRWSRFGCLERR
jgi:alkanesulfonate monooxygenase SsuD/methylene tetrahydromethanopterin reductase-like flavin-dependent oxidoreductase (luciferase family)